MAKKVDEKLSVPYIKTKRNDKGMVVDENRLTIEEFVKLIAPGANELEKKTGIFASLTIAQAIQETGLGNSRIAREAGNIFGVKSTGKPQNISYKVPNGNSYINFLNYSSVKKINDRAQKLKAAWEESVKHREELIGKEKIYNLVKQAADPESAAFLLQYSYNGYRSIEDGGYAEDNLYPKVLIEHIEKYKLNQYDVKGQSWPTRSIYVVKNPRYNNELLKKGFKPNSFQKKYYVIPCDKNGNYKTNQGKGYEMVLFADFTRGDKMEKKGIRAIQQYDEVDWSYLTNPRLK
jgi:flagellum-specific peptidoglycan hydrolase FlgJ